MYKSFIIIFVFLMFGYQGYAQLVWNKSFGTSDNDYPRQIKRLSTGGFLFCGDNNFNVGFLAKINSNGDSVWTKKLFPNDTDKTLRANTIYQVNSNNFIVGGSGSKNLTPNTSYGSLWGMDSSSNILWYRQTSSLIANILDFKNGHLIYTDYNNLTRIDTFGNIVWSISFDQYIKPSNILKTINGTYCFLYHDSLQQMYYKEISENGIVLRDESLPFLNISAEYGLFIQDSAGNFLVATDEGSLILRKFNSNLVFIWMKTYPIQLYLYSLVQATNMDYVVVGESQVTGDAEFGFIRISENGDLKATRIFGPLGKFDSPRDACSDNDGGVVILGYYEDGPDGGYDYLLVKSIVGIDTGVPDEERFLGIEVYPNPATNISNISFQQEFSGQILITDLLGKKILIENLKNVMTHTIQLLNLSKGIYFIKLIDEKKTIKIIKLIIN